MSLIVDDGVDAGEPPARRVVDDGVAGRRRCRLDALRRRPAMLWVEVFWVGVPDVVRVVSAMKSSANPTGKTSRKPCVKNNRDHSRFHRRWTGQAPRRTASARLERTVRAPGFIVAGSQFGDAPRSAAFVRARWRRRAVPCRRADRAEVDSTRQSMQAPAGPDVRRSRRAASPENRARRRAGDIAICASAPDPRHASVACRWPRRVPARCLSVSNDFSASRAFSSTLPDFDKAALRLVVFARGGLVALAFVARAGLPLMSVCPACDLLSRCCRTNGAGWRDGSAAPVI